MKNMSLQNLVTLEDIKIMCRICLTQSDNMISMEDKLDDEFEDSPLISEVLENILSVQVNDDINYPREICNLCHGNLKILFELKHLFNKSQSILEKYVSSLVCTITEDDFIICLEDENSQNSVSSVEDNDSYLTKSKVEPIDIKEDDLQEHTYMPTKVIQLSVSKNEKSNVKVNWVEGNKFIIEKKQSAPRTLQKCTYCHKRFLTKEKLTAHLGFCKKYVVVNCDHCNSKFSSAARLQHHIKLRHSSNAPEVKCEICNQAFKNHNAKSYHKLTRHNTEGKKYKCDLCAKAFYIKNSLNQHMECHSRDVSKVVCPVCGKGFHYRGGLFYHMKIHRNERNYICTFCNRRFLTMASLKRHTRIHTGERPYSCSMCPKTFCSVGEVKTHERRHTGQKPFECKYCSKCFISPYNLKLHVSSHYGTEPCDFCEKAFLNNEALKYHMEMKHNIKDRKGQMEDDI